MKHTNNFTLQTTCPAIAYDRELLPRDIFVRFFQSEVISKRQHADLE
jgi:hypothetical protein